MPLFNQRYKNSFLFFPSNYTLIFQIDGQLNHIYQERIRFKDRGLDRKRQQKELVFFLKKLGAKYSPWSSDFSNYKLVVPKNL